MDFFTHYKENNNASRWTAHKENPKQHEKYHRIFGMKNYLYAWRFIIAYYLPNRQKIYYTKSIL